MQFKNILLAAAAAATAIAAPLIGGVPTSLGGPSGSFPRLAGYPYGNPVCMSNAQAAFIVKTFKGILMNPDRAAAGAAAAAFVTDDYVETSDSINQLAGYPQGGPSFNGKQGFVMGVTYAPAIAVMDDADIWHDCTKVGWQWTVGSFGARFGPAKGFNKLVIDPQTGFLKTNDLEFNSIAWGSNMGGVWTSPPSH